MLRRIIFVAVVLTVGAAGFAGFQWVTSGGPTLNDGFYARDESAKEAGFSYDAYAKVLKAYVDEDGQVDYAGLKADRDGLDQFVRSIGWLPAEVYNKWGRDERLAFWMNTYNALTLKLVIDNYPIKPGRLGKMVGPANSVKQIPNRWSKPFFLVKGAPTSLDEIEHEILREQKKKSAHRQFGDPRIHMTLVCAARSCPPLRDEPYDPKRLDEQFADQARRFVAAPSRFQIDTDTDQVYLSSIFKWFGGDFIARYAPPSGFGRGGAAQRATLHYVSEFLPPEQADYLRNRNYKVAYLRYDWSLNEQSKAPAATPAKE